jgi:type IV pilus assembly protein PilB
MAGRKRGGSLEERLAKIRTSSPEESPAPVETPQPPIAAAPPEPVVGPEPPVATAQPELITTEPAVAAAPPETLAAPEPFESAQSFYSFGAIAASADPAPPASLDSALLSAAPEGDTFLPGAAANRVDVGAAVQAAVRQLLPEIEGAEQPAELESSPEETPLLSKLLGRGWMSARRSTQERRDSPGDIPGREPVEDATPAVDEARFDPAPFSAAEPDETAPDEPEPDSTPELDAFPFVEAVAEIAEGPTTGEMSELGEIVAEIAEITEVAPPPQWVPVRGRIPKPRPFEPEPEPEPVIDDVVDDVVEEIVEEIVEEVVEPEPPQPEPVVDEPVVDEVVVPAPQAEFDASEQAEVDAFVAEAEAAEEHAAPKADGSHWERRVRTERFGRIGTTLIERGLITNEQLDEALEVQRISGRRVGDILVELGALSPFELARVLADHMGVPFTDLRTKPPDPIIANLLPEEVARRYDALAISRWNDQLVIAMANPTDLFALDDLQMVTRQPIIAAMAVKEDLRAAIDRVYRVSIVETVDAAKVDYTAEAAEAAALEIDDADEGPIVGLVNALMNQAITDHASDLHIEPCSTHIAIRMRIDGVLHDSSTVPLELLRPVISRVKILAGMDIAQNRLAQDGRFSLTIDGRSVDVRVVTMPTAAGEAVILRLLDPIRDALSVSSLGLSAAEHARFMPAFMASQGAVFIAGPTGSGKTSSIYAVLSEVNTRTKSIVSIEDPVEFRLDGIKQLQLNPRAGLTFPTALPTVLRSDPDVVFIGEVRDTETARIAADAAITGHLVLSTLHATRAASAPMRLIEMGVEPYLVASALTLVASQRLARRLCEHCAVPADEATIEQLRALGAEDAELDGATVRRAVGCMACRGTGYRGRLPIFEIMPVTEGISRLILDRAPRAQIEDLAVEEGMDTMLRASVKRVVRGDLSVEEMLRVIS